MNCLQSAFATLRYKIIHQYNKLTIVFCTNWQMKFLLFLLFLGSMCSLTFTIHDKFEVKPPSILWSNTNWHWILANSTTLSLWISSSVVTPHIIGKNCCNFFSSPAVVRECVRNLTQELTSFTKFFIVEDDIFAWRCTKCKSVASTFTW